MEVSNFATQPRIIRTTIINNGSWYNNKDLSSMPCSCVSSFRKQYNLAAICKPKQEMDVKPLSGCLFKEIPSRSASLKDAAVRLRQRCGLMKAPLKLKKYLSSSCFLTPCQAKREDYSEGTESIILDEQTLEHELQIAIQDENYAQAAKIRDSLKLLHEDSKSAVLAANSRFYNSFRNGDLAAMQELWSKTENVCVVHPGVSGISGYELVMGSWEFVWADYEFPLSIEVKDVQVYVRGDMGYVTCVEMVRTTGKSWGRQFATNVFEKINGRWFICVHHASHVDL